MQIAIIGAGNVGSALAGSSVQAGHTVSISSSKPEDAERVARETGATAAGSNREAVEGADLVVLGVWFAHVPEILDELGDALEGKVLVDATNRWDQDDPAGVIDGSSNAEEIQARDPQARVVKALNTVLASRQAEPIADGVPLDGYVAGDDDVAKKTVLELLGSIGLRAIDVGSLSMSRALEAMAVLNMALNMQHGWSWQTGWKLLGPTGVEG